MKGYRTCFFPVRFHGAGGYLVRMIAPVVLIAFNRPDETEQTFARIREVAPTELFVIIDGPRATHPADAAKVDAVTEIVSRVDWPCTVHRRIADLNLGCAANIELGLDWVFQHVPHAIILEDDCLGDATFFRYCTELLERHAPDNDIWHIGGAAPIAQASAYDGADYAFTAIASIWGWATWARAWSSHRSMFPRTHVAGDTVPRRSEPDLVWPADTRLTRPSAERYFRRAHSASADYASTWAIHWTLSALTARSFAISSATVLVKNVGFGGSASRTASNRTMPDTSAVSFPLRHPAAVEINREVEAVMEQTVAREFGLLARAARRILRGPVRDVARRLHYRRTGTSPPST